MNLPRIAALALILAIAPDSFAQYYIAVDAGPHLAPALTFNNNSNDRSSVCDEFINPLFASVPGCTDPARGTGDGYKAEFAGASGMTTTLAVGRRFLDRVSAEFEHVLHTSRYKQVTDIGAGIGVHEDKLTQEIFVARETLGDVTGRSLMVNAFFAFVDSDFASWVPYVGAGAGMSRITSFYTSTWYRNPTVDAIRTGEGLPNANEVRHNLAGTMSNGSAKITDWVPAWQVFVGLDYMLDDDLSLGIRIRSLNMAEFESDQLEWNPLRSHAPNIRLDGSEPVNAFLRTSDLRIFSAGVVMRYHF